MARGARWRTLEMPAASGGQTSERQTTTDTRSLAAYRLQRYTAMSGYQLPGTGRANRARHARSERAGAHRQTGRVAHLGDRWERAVEFGAMPGSPHLRLGDRRTAAALGA